MVEMVSSEKRGAREIPRGGSSTYELCEDDVPVSGLEWYDAEAFSIWLSKKEGANYYEWGFSIFRVAPFVPGMKPLRVQRGAGWRDGLKDGHATHRFAAEPNQGYDRYGFRVVREAQASAARE
jgi:formylglycine-generating enzyme required for sulfatase activity